MKSLDRIRIAAIEFLNPAPLLYSFEHEPAATALCVRYDIAYTLPARCAEQLRTGEADLGLVPIGAMPTIPGLVAVPGCTIASLAKVRSIQLIVKPGLSLEEIRSVAADQASRSSVAYLRILLREFYANDPIFRAEPADPETMLQGNDAALLIGDPALLALERRDRDGLFAEHSWVDVATLWRQHTDLPWVAAVWAVQPGALQRTGVSEQQLIDDLQGSRDAGLSNIEQLVEDWAPRLPLSRDTIRTYLTQNIHYQLDDACLRAVKRFHELASRTGVLPSYHMPFL